MYWLLKLKWSNGLKGLKWGWKIMCLSFFFIKSCWYVLKCNCVCLVVVYLVMWILWLMWLIDLCCIIKCWLSLNWKSFNCCWCYCKIWGVFIIVMSCLILFGVINIFWLYVLWIIIFCICGKNCYNWILRFCVVLVIVLKEFLYDLCFFL